MKKILISSILIALFLNNCMSVFDKKVKGSGSVITEARSVSSFDKIEIGGIFNVFLSQGDVENVEVEIDDNLQQYVKIYNEGNTLVVDAEKGVNWKRVTKNNVYITLKNINELNVKGVCTVKSRTALKCDNLELDVEGIGNSRLELYCHQLDIKHGGVGSIELNGETVDLIIRKNGVGHLDAKNLKADNVNIKNSGVGSAEIYASKELTIRNSGVGSISYSGDATIKSVHSDGVGKINKSE